jgi:uncharacterized protein (TIGR04255 family)
MSSTPDQLMPFRPCNGLHSVKEASVALFVSSPITGIHEFLDFHKGNDNLKEILPESKIVYKVNSKASSTTDYKNISPESSIGFIIAKVDKNNNLERHFQGINELDNRYFFSYHESAYTRWLPFKEELSSVLDTFRNLLHDYTYDGLSLTYTDEYYWDDNQPIDYNLIFRKDTKFIPPIFFEEGNTSSELTSTMNISEKGLNFYVRFNIEPLQRPEGSVLRIIHTAAYVDEPILLSTFLYDSNSSFKQIIQTAHELNKRVLKELLLESVIDMIHMK